MIRSLDPNNQFKSDKETERFNLSPGHYQIIVGGAFPHNTTVKIDQVWGDEKLQPHQPGAGLRHNIGTFNNFKYSGVAEFTAQEYPTVIEISGNKPTLDITIHFRGAVWG